MAKELNKRRKLIANNSGSSIYRCFIGDEQPFVEKEIIKSKYKNWKEEYEILQKVGRDHENVVRYYPAAYDSDLVIILKMELCHADMEKYVLNQAIIDLTSFNETSNIPAKDFFQINVYDACFQAINGLHYLHVIHNIIHREIKPSNFLLVRTAGLKTVVKVADFGLSKKVEEDSYHSNTTTSSCFAAPECYDHRWKKASDIFSLGVFLYYAFTGGCHPFEKEPNEQEFKLRNKQNPNFEQMRKNTADFSKEQVVTLIDLIKRMIKYNPEDRFNIDQVLHHPTFWSSEKKARFYVRINSTVQSTKDEDFVKNLNFYDCGLLDDNKKKSSKFSISLNDIPDCLRNHEKYPVKKCSVIKSLVKVIRNVEAHIFDSINTEEYRKTLGREGNEVNWDKFLSVLTGNFPQLLAHLYELLRAMNVASEFYRGNPTTQILPSMTWTPQQSSSSHLDWRNFFESEYKGVSSIFDYQLIALYENQVVLEEVFNLRENKVKILYPSPNNQQSSDSSLQEFSFPPAEESNILSNCTNGVILSTDTSGNTLFVTRQCKCRVYFSSFCQTQSEALVSNKSTMLFSHSSLMQSLEKKDKSLRNDVRLVFGKDPKTNNFLKVVLLIKPVVAVSVKENLIPWNEDDILVSL